MTTAEILALHDRCPRAAFYGKKWEASRIHPNEVLRQAVEAGLLTDEEDPGQLAGDTVMTLATERELAVEGSQYSCAMHHAALSDVITTVLRAGMPKLGRPEDRECQSPPWTSSAFLDASGLRLRRVLMVDRWSSEREAAESHSWRSLGEMSIFGMPMTLTVVVIGQRRDGKHHSPWSKGFLHPANRNLRIKKRDGETFGKNWTQCWREEQAWISRDKWIDAMREDRVLHEAVFDVELDLPDADMMAKVRRLAQSKLREIRLARELPDPNISVCHYPVPCQFVDCCWNFKEPSERTGFIFR
jgi:hypothetical protein